MKLFLNEKQEMNYKDRILYTDIVGLNDCFIYDKKTGIILVKGIQENKNYTRYRINLDARFNDLNEICLKAILNEVPLEASKIEKEYERVSFDILVPKHTFIKLGIESMTSNTNLLLNSSLEIDQL